MKEHNILALDHDFWMQQHGVDHHQWLWPALPTAAATQAYWNDPITANMQFTFVHGGSPRKLPPMPYIFRKVSSSWFNWRVMLQLTMFEILVVKWSKFRPNFFWFWGLGGTTPETGEDASGTHTTHTWWYIYIPGGAKKSPALCITITAHILYREKFLFAHL